jgi:hypothetical protein
MARKMKALDTAIFSNYSPAVFKFPSCLVSKLKYSARGDVRFSIKRVYEDMDGFDLSFPGHMHFFNSAFDYYIEANGQATVDIRGDNVCIRFRIEQAQYCYSPGRNSKGLYRLFHNFMKFILARRMSVLWYDAVQPENV